MVKKNSQVKYKRVKVPSQLEAKLLVESRNTCNLCWTSKEVQIHHIIPVELGGDNAEDNLIVVCLNCHSIAHTKKDMAKNLNPKTLQLYKETWINLVEQYPLIPTDLAQKGNDISLIKDILKSANRRALYFPLDLEVPRLMFNSLDSFRVTIQKSGYQLMSYKVAKEHIITIYKNLIEMTHFFPTQGFDSTCIHRMFGREGIDFIEYKRKIIRFHLNELAKLIGLEEPLFDDNEYKKIGFEIERKFGQKMQCYSNFNEKSETCIVCEYKTECLESSIKTV